MIVKRTKQAVEVAKRTNTKWVLIAPGCISQRMEWDYQTANLIENLRHCVAVAEPDGVVIVLEPLNWWANHPGLFLQKIPQAYMVCKAVNSPSCKIVDDLYHQQITEGNLIPNIDKAWSEIGAFHLGDNPGRKRADLRRDQLQEHLQAHLQEGLQGRALYGAWQEQGRLEGGRAGRHRCLPRLR